VRAEYTVIARSGSNGEFISNLINEFGEFSIYTITPDPLKVKTAILITYPRELFPWVMTDHFLQNVCDSYTIGDATNWNQIKQHYIGPGNYESPLDIPVENWAYHVVRSLDHIGVYAPLNGLKEDLLTVLNGVKCKTEVLSLQDILDNPDKVLDQISKITGAPVTDSIREFYLNVVKKQQLRLSPYMQAIANLLE